MGYSHYWTQPCDYGAESWETICESVRAIIATVENAYDVPLAYESDQPKRRPQITRTTIRFSGVLANGFETFSIDRKRDRHYRNDPEMYGWGCIKTGRRPYDIAVTAILAYLDAIGWEVKSDGRPEDWRDGVEVARDALPDFGMIDVPLNVRTRT